MKAQEKIARLARQRVSPAKGTAGAKARTQEKIRHIGAQCPFFSNSYGIFRGHGGTNGALGSLLVVCTFEDLFEGLE